MQGNRIAREEEIQLKLFIDGPRRRGARDRRMGRFCERAAETFLTYGLPIRVAEFTFPLFVRAAAYANPPHCRIPPLCMPIERVQAIPLMRKARSAIG